MKVPRRNWEEAEPSAICLRRADAPIVCEATQSSLRSGSASRSIPGLSDPGPLGDTRNSGGVRPRSAGSELVAPWLLLPVLAPTRYDKNWPGSLLLHDTSTRY